MSCNVKMKISAFGPGTKLETAEDGKTLQIEICSERQQLNFENHEKKWKMELTGPTKSDKLNKLSQTGGRGKRSRVSGAS